MDRRRPGVLDAEGAAETSKELIASLRKQLAAAQAEAAVAAVFVLRFLQREAAVLLSHS